MSPETVVDSAVDALRELLVRGAYRQGDRLPSERELAETMRVSRPALREALHRLAEAGLLVSRRGSGIFVADVDVTAVLQVRLRLEPFAAALAARHCAEGDERRLRAAIRTMRDALDDPVTFAAADAGAHTALAEIAGNPVLLDVLRRLGELNSLSRAVTGGDRAVRARVLRQMTAVVRAVVDHDEAAAEAAMQAHIGDVADVAQAARPPDRRPRPIL